MQGGSDAAQHVRAEWCVIGKSEWEDGDENGVQSFEELNE